MQLFLPISNTVFVYRCTDTPGSIDIFTVGYKKYHSSHHRRFNLAVSAGHGLNSNYYYGIVIDCGSSGSRAYLYYWPPHNGNPEELLQIKQLKDSHGNPVSKKIKPGKYYRKNIT